MLAEIALAMDMKVVGLDPALSIDAVWRLSNKATRIENLQILLNRADYISLHMPALDATKHLINDETLRLMKLSAVLLNFARERL